MILFCKYRRQKRLWLNAQGFSLIETVVVIAIVAIAAGMTVPNMLSHRPKYAFNRAVNDVYSNLQWARMTAIRENTSCRVEFDETNDSFSVIKNPGSGQVVLRTIDLTDEDEYHPDVGLAASGVDSITYNSRGTGSTGTIVVAFPYGYCDDNDDCCICITASSSGRVKKRTKASPKYNAECQDRCP